MLVEDTMEHNHETKKWIRSGSKNQRSKKNSNWKLLQINQIPSHLRFNKYVLSHYRPETNWIGCVKSLFYLHNETVNILTHGKIKNHLKIQNYSWYFAKLISEFLKI